MAHPQTNFSSNFQGVDPPLEGYWHDDPIPCGSGNVVTDIWPNPAGIPVVVKGFNALTAEDAANKLDKTGDASNTTSTFTKASGDTSTMTSGGKLSAIFTAISSFFASVASALGGKADKANITGATKCKITYNGQGIVTSGADLGASDIPNLSASKITSGTFSTDRIADDAITADKVKDGETLPVNISGKANTASTTYTIRKDVGAGVYTAIAELISRSPLLDYSYAGLILSFTTRTSYIEDVKGLIVISPYEFDRTDIYARTILLGERAITSGSNIPVFVIKGNADKKTLQVWSIVNRSCAVSLNVLNSSGWSFNEITDTSSSIPSDSYISELYKNVIARTTDNYNNSAQVGSTTTPVYIEPDGQVRECTQGATLKTNTATLYISGYYNTTPVYHVKDIKNGCVNYVHVKDTFSSNCNLTIEAPALATSEEYDYVVVFDTFTNSNLIGNIDVENCKTTGHFESGVFVHDAMSIPNATPAQVPMIIVTGNVARPQWYDRV